MKTAAGPSFDHVSLQNGEDYAMRPVMEGLCKYESLLDGTLDLGDLRRMNECLEVRDENAARQRAVSSNG